MFITYATTAEQDHYEIFETEEEARQAFCEWSELPYCYTSGYGPITASTEAHHPESPRVDKFKLSIFGFTIISWSLVYA